MCLPDSLVYNRCGDKTQITPRFRSPTLTSGLWWEVRRWTEPHLLFFWGGGRERRRGAKEEVWMAHCSLPFASFSPEHPSYCHLLYSVPHGCLPTPCVIYYLACSQFESLLNLELSSLTGLHIWPQMLPLTLPSLVGQVIKLPPHWCWCVGLRIMNMHRWCIYLNSSDFRGILFPSELNFEGSRVMCASWCVLLNVALITSVHSALYDKYRKWGWGGKELLSFLTQSNKQVWRRPVICRQTG